MDGVVLCIGFAGPDQADFFSAVARDSGSPAFGQDRIGKKIRDVDGDVLERGFEKPRKAGEGRLHIKRGNFFRRADDFIEAGNSSKEAAKFREGGEDRLAATLDDERDKADEMNAIAETPLAIEEKLGGFQI